MGSSEIPGVNELIILGEFGREHGGDLSPKAQDFLKWYNGQKKLWFAQREIIVEGKLEHLTMLVEDLRIRWWRDGTPPIWLSVAQRREGCVWWGVAKAGDPDADSEKRQGIIEAQELPDTRMRVVFKPLHFPDADVFWQMVDEFVEEMTRLGFIAQQPTPIGDAKEDGETAVPDWFPKKPETIATWKKAYSIMLRLDETYREEYYEGATEDPKPKIGDYSDTLAHEMDWRPSDKTTRRIKKAGDNGWLA